MVAFHHLLASAGLLQTVYSRSLPIKTVLVNNIIVPKTKSDFAKNNVTAQWAPTYPKEWGSEDFSYQFSVPDPEDTFGAIVTDDEKYLTLFNGTHVEFIDLDKNATVSTFRLQVPDGIMPLDFSLRPTADGGYDVFTSAAKYRYDNPTITVRTRISSDLKSVGEPITYQGGIGAISNQGKLVSPYGYVYDLGTTSDKPVATLKGQPDLTDFSFSPDGVHLATVSWHEETADLWNATSGEKIFEFPATKAQNWLTRFSPDGKYIAIALGSSNNTIQIYTLSDLKATPIEIKGFNDWPRQMDWSPNSQQIAIGDNGRLRIYNVPSKDVVQTWQVDAVDNVYASYDIRWLENGKKITFQFRNWRYLYDIDANTKWVWTPRVTDHAWGGTSLTLLKKREFIVTPDGDSTVRFYKL
ncbi:hypothetical protein N0V90_010772 [Kalmusia sp. IMI 367209]|nr:hypothetical protein N0V90_010772 [Kalmusia sp. IMI 367209]